MEYYILDGDLNVVRGIELFQSMIWTEKWYEAGDFELYLPATVETFKLYTDAAKSQLYIIQAKDATIENMRNVPVMVINSVKLDDTFDKGDFLIIKGKQAKSLLAQRIVWGDNKVVSGPVQDVFRNLVIENIISPTETDRTIPNIILGDVNTGYPFVDNPNGEPFINADLTGMTVYDAMVKISKDQNVGFDIVLDFTLKKLKFVVLGYKDRSRAQEANPWVTFAADFDNLIKSSYKVDTDNYKNIALVASTYEEYDKSTKSHKFIDASQVVKPYNLPNKPAGLNRFELYVKGDSPTLSDENDEINVASLRSNNATKGRTELEKYKSKIEISAEVSANITYHYGKDYKLGDLVTIQNEYGIRYDARVTAVTTTLTTSKDQTIPSFTIENWTGKEEDDDEKDKEEERRVDENGNYRQTEIGSTRLVGTGLKTSILWTEDVVHLKNGTTTTRSERSTEDGQTREVIVGHYDDSKYKVT